ncbi:DUF1826 domain-containing protein [uncultured Pelagimonas sp.]|uniref:DUF1826 domain-containing protein n=1 Tax=uncultured Pelagimonas sp. TaxID=1618102 RepID=UPI002607173B|nr:DUF1826 domain-containing protein [uncultured Pelagimonas sp.]
MSAATLHRFAQTHPVGVHIGDQATALRAIQDLGCAAAIWQRQPLPSFQNWIDTLDPDRLPTARIVLRSDRVRDAIGAICDDAKTHNGAERARLIDDIAALATLFAEVTSARYLRLRLDAVTTNACRKFHVDAITARLVCTYRGTGTQYGTAKPGNDPSRIFTTPTGAPIVLRGQNWPEKPRANLLHRSPPIAGTGETRLLLVLDKVEDPENAI